MLAQGQRQPVRFIATGLGVTVSVPRPFAEQSAVTAMNARADSAVLAVFRFNPIPPSCPPYPVASQTDQRTPSAVDTSRIPLPKSPSRAPAVRTVVTVDSSDSQQRATTPPRVAQQSSLDDRFSRRPEALVQRQSVRPGFRPRLRRFRAVDFGCRPIAGVRGRVVPRVRWRCRSSSRADAR